HDKQIHNESQIQTTTISYTTLYSHYEVVSDTRSGPLTLRGPCLKIRACVKFDVCLAHIMRQHKLERRGKDIVAGRSAECVAEYRGLGNVSRTHTRREPCPTDRLASQQRVAASNGRGQGRDIRTEVSLDRSIG